VFVLATFGLNGTFPVLKGTPQESLQALGTTSVKVFPINPGDKLTFP
jgi:hypothetical protein